MSLSKGGGLVEAMAGHHAISAIQPFQPVLWRSRLVAVLPHAVFLFRFLHAYLKSNGDLTLNCLPSLGPYLFLLVKQWIVSQSLYDASPI